MKQRCPICKKIITKDSETYPFCSSTCRMVDLGNALSETYKIDTPQDLEAPHTPIPEPHKGEG